MPDLIFVYGTLRNDQSNEMFHSLAQDSKPIGLGEVQAQLFDLGEYPGMTLSSNAADRVRGEVYELNPEKVEATWAALDEYEGCGPSDPSPHEYKRRRVTVTLTDGRKVNAKAYVLTTVPLHAVRVPGGDYLTWRKAKRRPAASHHP